MISDWKKVLATSEEKQSLKWGAGPGRDRWLGDEFPGCALPCREAGYRWVQIRCNGVYTCAQVRDLGPWAHDDRDYVFGIARPRAEIYKGKQCPLTLGGDISHVATLPDGTPCLKSNGGGIDLFAATIRALGLNPGDNVLVEWRFIES